MKKLLKTIFVIISLAAIVGCGYFGYMYFKDKFPGGNDLSLTSADAKELAYTAAYDLNAITSTQFQTNINKTPITKPSNYSTEVNAPANTIDTNNHQEVYNDYTSDYIYLKIDSNISEMIDIYREDCLTTVCDFFENDITENTYYSLGNYVGSYDINENKLIFRLYNTNTYSSAPYSSNEKVIEYTLLGKTETGMTNYSLVIKLLLTYENASSKSADLFILKAEVGEKSQTDNTKQLNKFESAWSYTDKIVYKTLAEIENDTTTLFDNYAYACDITTNKILYYTSYEKTTADKILTSVVKNVTINSREFYSGKTIINL